MVGTVRKVRQDQVDLPDVASGLAAEGTLESTANKGVAGGYAELDGTGKLPAAQLPASVSGALNYQGTYDASGNVAPSPPGLATGWYYIISVGGTYDGDTYLPGDWTVYNGTGWDKIDNTEETDHGALTGLGDDDHTQYHNDARGDVRYYTKTQSDLNYQPLDSDLTAIAGLVPSNDDFVQRKAGAWVNRTPAQVKTDLDLLGTNTGDQTITLTGEVTGSGTGTFATALSATGVTPATYKSVTVDSKGRVTSGTNPTTLTGYGITDAQPLDSDLTAIAGLTPANDDFVQRKAGAWTNRTPAQVVVDLPVFVGGAGGSKGLVPTSSATELTEKRLLAADGTWAERAKLIQAFHAEIPSQSILTSNTPSPPTSYPVMVLDNTIPQNTEGGPVTTSTALTITPKRTDSKFLVSFPMWVDTGTNNRNLIVAMFKDSVANALTGSAVHVNVATAGRPQSLDIQFSFSTGTLTPFTLQIRAACVDAGQTLYINSNKDGFNLGGAASSFIIIEEVLA